MEKEMVLTTGMLNGKSFALVIRYIINKVNIPVGILRRYYSNVLEKDVSMRQTWMLIEAQTAFFAGILPINIHIAVRILMIVWFVATLKKCRKNGL